MVVTIYKNTCKELLSLAGISIDGDQPWDMHVHDQRVYQRILSQGSIGLGESYMDGWWNCDRLDEFFDKILRANLNKKVKNDWGLLLKAISTRIFNLQSIRHSSEVAEKHYNLGNDLYRAMLDKRMNYTCAYWKNAKSLDEAQEQKLDLICKKICLEPGMTVLELGCGWGSFAKYATEKYGARVVAVNIAEEQVKLARELCKGLPVEIRLEDYRKVEGKYDRVLSIGILEHVGYKNYRTYMKTADRCLKEDGISFFHAIGGNNSNTQTDPWIDKYIFPHGMIPSISQVGNAMEGLFIMEDWHNFGEDYDKTLMAWKENFEKAWPGLKDRYGEHFYRMWRYYLLSCAGGFRSRHMQLWQVVMTKPGIKQPACRIS